MGRRGGAGRDLPLHEVREEGELLRPVPEVEHPEQRPQRRRVRIHPPRRRRGPPRRRRLPAAGAARDADGRGEGGGGRPGTGPGVLGPEEDEVGPGRSASPGGGGDAEALTAVDGGGADAGDEA